METTKTHSTVETPHEGTNDVSPTGKCKPCYMPFQAFKNETQSYTKNCGFILFERIRSQLTAYDVADLVADYKRLTKPPNRSGYHDRFAFFLIQELATLKIALLELTSPSSQTLSK